MDLNTDIAIVGGGVIGLSIARELRRSGVPKILVIERGEIGRGASFAAAGMLAPNAENEVVDDFYRFCDGSRRMFPPLAEELLTETGVDIQLDRSGTLFTALTPADSEHLSQRHGRQLAAGIPVERLSAEETLKVEPHLSKNVRESLYFPNDWQVENRQLLAALEHYAQNNGIEIVAGRAVSSLIVDDGRVKGISVGETRIFGGATVLATGAWTSMVKLGAEQLPFTIKPIRGQMISFRPGKSRFKRVIYSPRGYLVPRADGRVLAGATVEDVGFDTTVTEPAIRNLQHSAAEIAPCLNDCKIVEKWAGLRPFAEDGLPVIGAIEGLTDLFVATAHYRNGILLAPATAKLMAKLIVEGTASKYVGLFGPQRLINKENFAAA